MLWLFFQGWFFLSILISIIVYFVPAICLAWQAPSSLLVKDGECCVGSERLCAVVHCYPSAIDLWWWSWSPFDPVMIGWGLFRWARPTQFSCPWPLLLGAHGAVCPFISGNYPCSDSPLLVVCVLPYGLLVGSSSSLGLPIVLHVWWLMWGRFRCACTGTFLHTGHICLCGTDGHDIDGIIYRRYGQRLPVQAAFTSLAVASGPEDHLDFPLVELPTSPKRRVFSVWSCLLIQMVFTIVGCVQSLSKLVDNWIRYFCIQPW